MSKYKITEKKYSAAKEREKNELRGHKMQQSTFNGI